MRDFVRSSQFKAIASRGGEEGVNRKDKKWSRQNLAPGFPPVFADSPRFLRGARHLSKAAPLEKRNQPDPPND